MTHKQNTVLFSFLTEHQKISYPIISKSSNPGIKTFSSTSYSTPIERKIVSTIFKTILDLNNIRRIIKNELPTPKRNAQIIFQKKINNVTITK
jgi:hypothetical protein